MKLAELVKAVRANGMKVMFLRWLYNPDIVEEDFIGALAFQFGNTARLDGITIHMDNKLMSLITKGELILGKYEAHERQLIQKYLPLDEPVIELGGSIGVVACTINRRLVAPVQHIVVEANPDLIPTLKKNRDINGCQFEIIEAAIGYGSPSITFFTDEDSLTGSIYHTKGRAIEVPVQTLQSIAEKAKFRHFNLISDIEGSEIGLIDHEMDFIREHVGIILMELHGFIASYGSEGVQLTIETLKENGFEMIDTIGSNYCFRNNHFLDE
jgi:FkbM family methyltransferase